MKFYCVLVLLVLVAVYAEERKDYTNYKFIQVYPNTEAEALLIADWEIQNNDFDIWNSAKKPNPFFDVLLSPEAFEVYEAKLNSMNVPFFVVHENMQEVVNEEAKNLERSRMEGRVVNTYPRFADLQTWLQDVNAKNPTITDLFSIGTSNQGRDLTVLKIKVGSPARKVWIDCGIHAREWISPATCVNIIDKLINDYNNGVAAIVNFLNQFEFHILPVHNPDGYEYAQTNDRYWRKNRKTNSGSTCVGVDLNRNFPSMWLTGGSSSDPCSDTHAGPNVASEPETQAVINYVDPKTKTWAAFLTLHSYGNWFLTAYGNQTALPPDYASVLKPNGDTFAAAVKAVYGEVFTVGSTANLLYIATGSSSDWGYLSGITNSYTIELRPKNGFSILGFVLDAAQIPLVGNEIYAGLQALWNVI